MSWLGDKQKVWVTAFGLRSGQPPQRSHYRTLPGWVSVVVLPFLKLRLWVWWDL